MLATELNTDLTSILPIFVEKIILQNLTVMSQYGNCYPPLYLVHLCYILSEQTVPVCMCDNSMIIL
jgi:hypothetical protein